MSDQHTSDEIDLIELFEIMWAGKWFIAGVTGLVAVLAFITLSLMPSKFEMSLSVRPLSTQQMSAYAPLNNVPGISTPIYAGEILIGQTGVISADDLRDEFYGTFRAGRVLQEAINENDSRFINFQGTEQEKADELVREASEFKLENIKSENTSQIMTTTADPITTRKILESFIEKSSETIRRQNLIAIANLSRSIETTLNYEIEELKLTIENDRQLYLDSVNSRTAMLGEQAKIARALGIETPVNETNITTSVTTANANSDSNGVFAENTRLFMRGYKALETEAKILKARKGASADLFAPNYAENARRLRELEGDQRLSRIETGLALTPLSDIENFTPVNFDTENILVKPAGNKLLILVLMTLLAGLASSTFILIRHYTMQRKLAS